MIIGCRDVRTGAALRHLPSGTRAANTVWMWGALLAVNLSAWLQALAGLDTGDGRGRAHLGTLRHQLLNVPARLVRHAGQLTPAPVPRPPATRAGPRPTPPPARLDLTKAPPGPDPPPETNEPAPPGHQHALRAKHRTTNRPSAMYPDHASAIRGSGSE